MPRIRRYHPVSHDLNRDPEMWEFRELIGQRADAMWLEILSIADRNDGYLPGNWNDYPRLLAGACHSTPSRVGVALKWLTTPRGRLLRPWVELDLKKGARVTNYTDYHRTREPKQAPSEHPSEPSEHNRTKHLKTPEPDVPLKAPEKEKPEPAWVAPFRRLYQSDPRRFALLNGWVATNVPMYGPRRVREALEIFEKNDKTGHVDHVFKYLDVLIDKHTAKANFAEHEADHNADKEAEARWSKANMRA